MEKPSLTRGGGHHKCCHSLLVSGRVSFYSSFTSPEDLSRTVPGAAGMQMEGE